MIKEISDDEWNGLIKGSPYESVMFYPEVMQAVSNAFKCDIKYWVVLHKTKAVAAFASFEKNRRLVLPVFYLYSAIWLAETEKSLLYRNTLTEGLKQLKKIYTSINLRLPPSFKDTRPFLWQNFSPKLRYTYIKDLKDQNYAHNVRSRIKKAIETGIQINEYHEFENAWEQHSGDLKLYGFSVKSIKKLKQVFQAWYFTGVLKIISAQKNDSLIASAFVLLDQHQQKGYNLLISSGQQYYETGVHEALYDGIFKYLLNQGYYKCDLYGANMRNVAEFKAKFNAELSPYYEVSYYRGKDLKVGVTTSLKSLIKKIIP